jgi:NADH-quinone oxidoreductase subunit L
MGVGAYGAGIFHLYTHAFFKALLFLGSGAVIHALAGEQDLRNMGGLKKGLPITYWTFVIGAIAIAGVPPLAGFFSKDEILWRTFAGGHRILWIVGLITSFLTATYMFRLVFLAFHGERRHDAPAAAPAHPEEEEPAAHHASDIGHGSSDIGGHAHGDHAHGLHDAPPAMAFALVVLAIGSIAAGWVGWPHALFGGNNRIEKFLEPSFEAHATAPANPEFQVVQGRQPANPGPVELHEQAAGEGAAHEGGDESTELSLMILSSGLALAGIGLAWYFWLRNRPAATRAARSAAPVYTLLLNKYYVDEIYNAVIVQPIKGVSTFVLWKAADAALIDGAVNGVGGLVRASSSTFRRLQTGSVRAYAASLFLGVVVILGWYLLR